MLKKSISFVVIITMMLSNFIGLGLAEELNGFEYTLSDGKATIINYTGSDTEVNIPNDLNGNEVISIAGVTFKDNQAITKVIIPATVVSITGEAFSNSNPTLIIECLSWNVPVMEFAIQNGFATQSCNMIIDNNKVLKKLGSPYYSGGATSPLVIPQGVVEIGGSNAFIHGQFTEVVIPSTVTKIKYGAFYETKLTSVTIPEGVQQIANDSFGYCADLASVSIPASATSLGENVFRCCPNLSSISVHADNPNYSSVNGVLYNKDKSILREYPSAPVSLTIPGNVSTVYNSALYQNTNVKYIKTNNVVTLNHLAFGSCSKLESVYFDPSLARIDGSAVYGNYALRNIAIVNDNISIHENGFNSTDGIVNVFCNEGSNAWNFFGSKAVKPLAISNIPASNKLTIGDTYDLGVTEVEAFTQMYGYHPNLPINWQTSNPSVLSIDNTGLITALTRGTATITLSRVDGFRDSIDITVLSPNEVAFTYTDNGVFLTDKITSNARVYVTGTTLPNANIALFNNGANVAEQNASSNGSYEFSYDLLEGVNSLQSFIIGDGPVYIHGSDTLTITLDTTSPQIVYQSPVNIGNSLYEDIIIHTNEKLYSLQDQELTTAEIQQLDSNDYILQFSGPNVMPTTAIASYNSSENKHEIVANCLELLYPNTEYSFSFRNIQDSSGNYLYHSKQTFTTDSIMPAIISESNISCGTSNENIVTNYFGNEYNIDLTKLNYWNEGALFSSLKPATNAFNNSRVNSTSNYDDYVGLDINISLGNVGYDKCYINMHHPSGHRWSHHADITTNAEGQAIVKVYPHIARISESDWRVAGGTSSYKVYILAYSSSNKASYELYSTTINISNDYSAPDNYTISASGYINKANANNFSFRIGSAEVGAKCKYSIYNTENDSFKVEGEALITSDNTEIASTEFLIENLNLSAINDGLLKIEVVLIDNHNNKGSTETRYITKNTSQAATTISSTESATTYKKSIPIRVEFTKGLDKVNMPQFANCEEDIVIENGVIDYIRSGHDNGQHYYFNVSPTNYDLEQSIKVKVPANTVTDQYGNYNLESNEFTINYEPNNLPQVDMYPDSNNYLELNETVSYDLNEVFSDPDNDELVFTVKTFDGQTYTPLTNPLGNFNITNSTWTYTPVNENLNKYYTIEFYANDNKSGTTNVMFSLRTPDKIDFTVVKTDCSAYNVNDGSIEIQISNPERYRFSIDGGNTYTEQTLFTSLAANTYYIIVKDTVVDNNYSQQYDVTITKPNKPIPPVQEITYSPAPRHEVFKAFDEAKEDKKGDKIADIIVNKLNSANQYLQNVPSTYFRGQGKKLKVDTPLANLYLKNNMFKNNVSGLLDFTVSEVDTSKLSKELKETIGSNRVVNIDLYRNRRLFNWDESKGELEIELKVDLGTDISSEEFQDTIIAYNLTDDGRLVPIVLSHYNPVTKTVSFKVSHLSMFTFINNKREYTDIDNYSWAKKAIQALAARKVIAGTTKTTFSPASNTERADMVIFVNRFFSIKATPQDNYIDVIEGEYYYNEVAKAKAAGILDKIATDIFRPEEMITREDMMVLVYESLKYTELANRLVLNESISITNFSDYTEISEYAKESVDYLVKAGIVGGYDNKIYPKDYTTRAEVVALLYKLLLKLNSN